MGLTPYTGGVWVVSILGSGVDVCALLEAPWLGYKSPPYGWNGHTHACMAGWLAAVQPLQERRRGLWVEECWVLGGLEVWWLAT